MNSIQLYARLSHTLLHIVLCFLYSGDSCEMNVVPYCDDEQLEALGLHMYQRCKKKHVHDSYITVRQFTPDHLPLAVRYQELYNFIRWHAKHTVLLRVCHLAKERPEKFRLGGTTINHQHLGTGFAEIIDMSKPDQVNNCKGFNPNTSFLVRTAAHTVFDQRECETTVVRFFYEEDRDLTTVMRARGRKILSVSERQDMSLFLCEVENESVSEKIKGEFKKYNPRFTAVARHLTEIIAYTVSHPHGLAQRVSLGKIKSVKNTGVGSYWLKLLIHSYCDRLPIPPEKALYTYIRYFVCEKRTDGWNENLVAFLTDHQTEVLTDLENKGIIEPPTELELTVMREDCVELRIECGDQVDERIRERFGDKHLTDVEVKDWEEDILYDVIDELPHKTYTSPEYKQLVKSMHDNIVQQFKECSSTKDKRIYQRKRTVNYDIPTCVGSSGARIVATEVHGNEINLMMSIHNTGGSNYNKSNNGESVIGLL